VRILGRGEGIIRDGAKEIDKGGRRGDRLEADRPVGPHTGDHMSLKEKIIHEALKLFSLKGYMNTSVEDIIARASASKGGFYNHFKTKDELFLAVLSEARKMWRQRVLDGLDNVARPIEKLRKILENYQDRYLKDVENIPGGCIFVTLSVELDHQRTDFASELAEGFKRTRTLLKRLLDQARDAGELRDDVDTDLASQVLFAGMLGSSVLYGLDRSSDSMGCSIKALIEYLDTLTT
jgi:AcrR family transcriptional regulator